MGRPPRPPELQPPDRSGGPAQIFLRDLVRAVQQDRLKEFTKGRKAITCRHCKAINPLGVEILSRKRVGCLACVPLARCCVVCEQMRSVMHFDVTGDRINSYCRDCRRDLNRNWYFAAQAQRPRPPARLLCEGCGRVRRSRHFAKDGRYRTGVHSLCNDCRIYPRERR